MACYGKLFFKRQSQIIAQSGFLWMSTLVMPQYQFPCWFSNTLIFRNLYLDRLWKHWSSVKWSNPVSLLIGKLLTLITKALLLNNKRGQPVNTIHSINQTWQTSNFKSMVFPSEGQVSRIEGENLIFVDVENILFLRKFLTLLMLYHSHFQLQQHDTSTRNTFYFIISRLRYSLDWDRNPRQK